MMLARPHMFPQLHHCYDGKYRCIFFTANGETHKVLCKYSTKRNVWIFRFRDATWYFHAAPPAGPEYII